jgi:hypothetical protein
VAREDGARAIDIEHLALGAFQTASVAMLFDRLGIEPDTLASALRRPGNKGRSDNRVSFSMSSKRALEQALRHAMDFSHPGITSAHILLGSVTADSAGAVASAFDDAGISADSLRRAIADLPIGLPEGMPSSQLRALLDNDDLEPGDRADLEGRLVKATIDERKLGEARELAVVFVEEGNQTVARMLLAIGEVTGDVNLIVAYARLAIEAAAGSVPAIRSAYGLALAHHGRFGEARAELTTARQAASTGDVGVLLRSAESELLAGDVVAGEKIYRQISQQDLADSPASGNYWNHWLRVGADIDHATGTNWTPPLRPVRDDSLMGRFSLHRLEVAQIRSAVRDRKLRRAARQARLLEETCRRAGFDGITVEALTIRAEALRQAGKPKAERMAKQAATLADRLGRTVLATRIRGQFQIA